MASMAHVEKRAVSHRRRDNGYCYVQLFKDVLGNKVNVKETKRIFGKFPRLKDVLAQLVRLSDHDLYVHDLVPTGLSLYHVNYEAVIPLSSLVMRFMFSDAIIGGYDITTDVALQQSDYARRIAALAHVGNQAAHNILETAAAVVLNKELAKPDSLMAQFVQDTASDSTRGRLIHLPYRLQPLELTNMQTDYPEFALMNVNNKSHPHSVAGNLRVLNMEVLLDMINYKKNASPLYGEDVYVVDIGGDYVCHVKSGRLNVHCDTPILTPRDSARETTRRLALGSMVKKGKMNRSTYDRLTGASGPCKQRCTNKAQDCNVTGTYAIMVHSEYDITRAELAAAFDMHKTKVAVSALHFDPRIFTQQSFMVESLKARVVVDGKRIHFDFSGDTSLSYSHDFDNYLEIVTTNMLLTPEGRCYLVEKVGLRGATLFIKYTLCDVEPEVREERLRCCFWLPEHDDRLVVSTWRFQTGYYRDNKFVRTAEDETNGRFLRKHLEVSKVLYDMILANCLRASEKGFNLSEMLSAAISFNARLTINGQDVRHNKDRLDVDLLIDLTVACYCQAYVLRYGAGKVVEFFTTQEKNKRNGKFGFLSLLGFCAQQLVPTRLFKKTWNCFLDYLSEKREEADMTFAVSQSVRVVTMEEHLCVLAGYDHHVGEATLDVGNETIDLLDIRDVLELKYEKGKLTGVVKSEEATPREKTGVVDVPSRSATLASTPTVMTKSSLSTTTLRKGDASKRKMKQITNQAVRAMSHLSASEPLSESKLNVLRDLRSETVTSCGRLHVTSMVGDGRCAFYAMLHCVGLEPSVASVEYLKTILWASCPEESKNDNRNLLLSDFSDVASWGTTDNFGLFSALVESILCVHVVTSENQELITKAYSKVDEAPHTMHVRWNVQGAGHVDMYESDSFAQDTKLRAANFVRNVQTLLFATKGSNPVFYEDTSVISKHDYVNRSGLKLLSLLASYPDLQTAGKVLDLCGAPGGFLSVLLKLNADVTSVSGPAIEYSNRVQDAKRLIVDITLENAIERFPKQEYDLVLADGGSDECYRDATLLLAQIDIMLHTLRPGANCVLKVCNFFTQLEVVSGFVKNFERVIISKPDFSAVGNTEVYLVCFGFGVECTGIVGEINVRRQLVDGLMKYFNCAVRELDLSDRKKVAFLIQVLEANVFGPSGEKRWRPTGLVGGSDEDREPLLSSLNKGCLVFENEMFESVDNVSTDTRETVVIDPTAVVGAIGAPLERETLDNISMVTLQCDVEVVSQVMEEVESAPTEDSRLSTPSVRSDAEDGERLRCQPLYDENIRDAVERYVDSAVLCESPREDSLTWKEKFGRMFGKQPKLCKTATKTDTIKYSLSSTKRMSAVGRLGSGRKLEKSQKVKVEHKMKRTQMKTTSTICRNVGTNGEDVTVENAMIVDRRVGVSVNSRGTCVDFSPKEVCVTNESLSPGKGAVENNTEASSGSFESSEDCDSGFADAEAASCASEESETSKISEKTTCREASERVMGLSDGVDLAAFVHGLEPVNVPDSEPIRATATYFAVDKIQQDFLVAYVWRLSDRKYKISKCMKELLGRSTIDRDVLKSMHGLATLSNGVRVVDTTIGGVKVCVLVLDTVDDLEDSLMMFLDQVAECCRGKLRLSLDVLVCKDYDVDCLRIMQFSNENTNIFFVLYLHNHFQKGRAFGSPYLYAGSFKPELFPKLTDEDLGLVRSPTLLDDAIMENRYKNSMIEYLHTSTFSQNVLAVKLKDIYNQVIADSFPNVQALARMEKKGYYFYDNEACAVMSGVVQPFGWAFTIEAGGARFCKYDEDSERYLGVSRYFLFTRETKILLTEDIAENLRKIDIIDVKMPKITWVNGPPGCGKTEYALRTHTKPSSKPEIVRGDIILTVTKEGALSLRKRLKGTVEEKYLKRNYRTVASVLMNGADEREFDRVIVDEALMVHAGALAFAAHILGAKELVLIGDVHQIPFIDRDHVTQIKYSNPDRFCSVSKTLNRTHRCPVDVTYLLSERYEGFYSVSKQVKSLRRERLSGRGVLKERDVVYLVLFQSDKEDLIRQGYGVDSRVLTVHEAQGQTFKHVRYVRLSPKALKLYESMGHAIVAISRHTESFVCYSDVDDIITQWIDRVSGQSEGELMRWNNERRVSNGETLKAGFYSPALVEFKPHVAAYAGPEAVKAMTVIGGVPHKPNTPQVLAPARAFCELPIIELRCPKDADLGYLQSWYDAVIPTAVDNDVTNDQLICESSDLQIALHDQLVVDPLRVGYKDKTYNRLKPVLRTLMPKNVVQSQVQTILCLSKRNANAPVLRNEELCPAVAAQYLFKNFVKSCLRDDFDRDTAFDVIQPNAVLLQQWLDKQPPGVKKMIQSDVPVEERKFHTFSFMVKDKLKPPLEPSAAYKIPGGQTIAYHSKDVNAYVCPIFAIARDRLLSILKTNILIMTGMSTEEFEATINAQFNIDDLWKTTNRVENDFSKYDKSQHETLLRFEIMLYEMLGVPRDLLDLWYESHRRSTLKDRSNGVWMRTEFQRKSGDAVTFLGNTVCLLAVTAACYDFDNVRLGLFAGDDSLLFVEKHAETYDATSAMADWFNLESKLLDHYLHPYFCSKFLINLNGVLHIVPDVLKTLTKWGRSDLVNREHVEEYRVSLSDSLKPYKNVLLHVIIDAAVRERYHTPLDTTKVLRVMVTYIENSELFQKIFVTDNEKKLMTGPSRPSLD